MTAAHLPRDRIIDLSYSAAQLIHMVGPGTALVRIDVLESPVKLRASAPTSTTLCNWVRSLKWKTPNSCAIASAKAFPDVAIAPLQSKDMTYYRVHLGTFPSRTAAEEQARQVTQAGYSVIIMEK